ncbi:MAG: ADP-ribosylglycohydrolase family protein [Candidatus Sumerlaeia bacterium]
MDKYTGSMLGQAVGDALGAPVEGLKGGHIQQIFGELNYYADPMTAFPDKPSRWRLPGLYTDDTQQALAVAEVLAIYGEADCRALADLYLRLMQEGPAEAPFGAHRGTGYFFRKSVPSMSRAKDVRNCGQFSAGNGAAMKMAPVGLYYANDLEAMARAVIDFSLMTHHDIRGIAGALAMAYVVARLVVAENADSEATAMEIAEGMSGFVARWEDRLAEEYADFIAPESLGMPRHYMSEALSVLPSLLREANDQLAEKTIVKGAQRSEPNENVSHAYCGFAVASVVIAIYRALSARNFAEGLIGVVNAGGDTDTVGAMAGAILGARFGAEQIPADWIDGLMNADFIKARARAMREKVVNWEAWGDYIDSEISLTEKEQKSIEIALADNEELLEQKRQKAMQKKAKKEEKQKHKDLGFAPPPEVWLADEEEEKDPIQSKKDRARRGKRRIAWKEERRRKQKRRGPDLDSDED